MSLSAIPSYSIPRNNAGMILNRNKVTRHRLRRFATLPLLFAAWLLAPGLAVADPLLTYPIQIGEHRLRVELANTPDTREQGLMFRQHMAADSGMIFVFPRDQVVAMWMKNTHIPLSVAFLDKYGRIVNIEDMEPLSEQTHRSARTVRFALETNQGWFKARGIKAGAKVTGLDRLPPPR